MIAQLNRKLRVLNIMFARVSRCTAVSPEPSESIAHTILRQVLKGKKQSNYAQVYFMPRPSHSTSFLAIVFDDDQLLGQKRDSKEQLKLGYITSLMQNLF